MKSGKLYLIPTPLGDSPFKDVIPEGLISIIEGINHFVVEDLRTARRFLKKVEPDININQLFFEELNEHTLETDIYPLIDPILSGNDVGLMSEAGSPCVADPGSSLVALAHEKGIKVIPLTGPSSMNLALMASGFNGQNYVFHGYLPVDQRKRNASIKKLEQDAYRKNQTQIFIETPYRNMKMFESIIASCNPASRLCIAANITTANEMIITRSIADWKKNPPAIHKQPAVFLIYK